MFISFINKRRTNKETNKQLKTSDLNFLIKRKKNKCL